MPEPGGLSMLKRYWVEGQTPHGSSAFGIPITDLPTAEELCRRRHLAGYRRLRIYDTHTNRMARFSIQYGCLGWYSASDPEVGAEVSLLQVER